MADKQQDSSDQGTGYAEWRFRMHEVIFEADTPSGKLFDVVLLVSILISVLAVMLDSVKSLSANYHGLFMAMEWGFTVLFTIEYVLRIVSIRKPANYIFSFYGIIDLLAILPTYLSLFMPGGQALLVIRALRLLRVFRVLKLARFIGEAQVLTKALHNSRRKILVFLTSVVILVVIFGALMYLIEGEKNGFTSIPRSVYWAIVTLTTVGYGDIHPNTILGQTIAAMIMIIGYGIIAVPTGIVTAEMVSASRISVSTQNCPTCAKEGHDSDASHCKFCGAELNPSEFSQNKETQGG